MNHPNYKAEAHIERKKPHSICLICGQPTKRRNMKYCSRECYLKYQRTEWRNKQKEAFIPKTYKCKWCGKIFETKYGDRGRRSYCSISCYKKASNKIEKGKRRARLRNNKYELVNAMLIYRRDKGKCQICGKKVKFYKNTLKSNSAQLDHIIPLSCNGEHTYRNIQLVCRTCNLFKGNGVVELREQLRLC